MISIRGLRVRRGAVPVLDGMSMEVHPGTIAALVGVSGGGKSTALRCLVGLEPFDEGDVSLGGLRLPPRASERRDAELLRGVRRRTGLIFQQYHLFPHLSVLENLTLAPCRAHGVAREEAAARARQQLARVGLEHRLGAFPGELSGGQQQRVAIARALMIEPEILLLDEPTSALDPAMVQGLTGLFERLAGEGLTLLIVTHSMALVKRAAARVHVLHEGRIVEEGPPAEVLGAPVHEATRSLLAGGLIHHGLAAHPVGMKLRWAFTAAGRFRGPLRAPGRAPG